MRIQERRRKRNIGYPSARNQDLAVREQRCGRPIPLNIKAARVTPRLRCRIIQLRSLTGIDAPSDENLAVSQKGCGVTNPGVIEIARFTPCSGRRIE